MKLKYIVFDHKYGAVFHEDIQHDEIAARVPRKATSAGFCILESNPSGDITANCFGKSVSLNLRGAEEDDEIITNTLTGY